MPPLQYLVPALQRAMVKAKAEPAKPEAPPEAQAEPEPVVEAPPEPQAEPEVPAVEAPPEAQGAEPAVEEPPPPTPLREAMHEIYAELPPPSPQKLDEAEPEEPPEKRARLEAPSEESVEAAQALPPLSPSPEREPTETKLGIGSFLADPANETRQEFLERCRKKLKTPLAKVIEKAKAVEGLWELWPGDEGAEPATKKRKTEKAAPKARAAAKSKTEPKAVPKAAPKPKAAPQAAPAEAAPRRGRNANLKDRILEGGEVDTQEEYEKIPDLIKLANRQHSRMVQSGKVREAEEASEEIRKLFEASDRWANANHVPRIRRVEQKHRQNDVLFRTGLQMIQAAHRQDGQLLEAELRLNRLSEQS